MKEFSKPDLFLYPKFLEETGKKNNLSSIKVFQSEWLPKRKRKAVDSLIEMFDTVNDELNPFK